MKSREKHLDKLSKWHEISISISMASDIQEQRNPEKYDHQQLKMCHVIKIKSGLQNRKIFTYQILSQPRTSDERKKRKNIKQVFFFSFIMLGHAKSGT